jgi:pimeloyl-ACP methyl ester carboxylesterase
VRRVAAAAAVAVASLLAVAPAEAADRHLRVGDVDLHHCVDPRGGWCGHVRRPLDPAAPGGPLIALAVRWYPAPRPSGAPPVAAVEGGPGYPSIGSASAYRAMLGPLLRRRSLLLVDARGTGGSSPVACAGLQHVRDAHTGRPYTALVGRCGVALDHRWRDGSRWVHAADRFSTADAADDLAAVLGRLGLPRVVLYGDSYGTWFAQSFAARHPSLLRAVVLDSAYPARGLDPTYAASAASARLSRDLACRTSAAGAGASTGTSSGDRATSVEGQRARGDRTRPSARRAFPSSAVGRLALLLRQVRRAPLHGLVRAAAGGATAPATVGPRQLSDLVQDAGSDAVILRELDAAVRAALQGDPAPLLRLQAHAGDADQGGSDLADFSTGDYWAVSCTDYPALFRPAAGRSARRAEYAAGLKRIPAGTFRPFTTPEWTAVDGVTQPYDGCLDWPRPVDARPAVPPGAPRLPASVPVLVLGGDLDSLTPASEDATVTRAMATRSRTVTIENAVHVPSEGDPSTPEASRCARSVVRAFLRRLRLTDVDARCATTTPAIHTVGAYPALMEDARPARVVAGRATELARRSVTVGVDAVADAVDRRTFDDGAGRGPGLRGGSFSARGDRVVRLRLHGDRFVGDATVVGVARWSTTTGTVRARLVVRPRGARPVAFRASWGTRHPTARARTGAARLDLPAP